MDEPMLTTPMNAIVEVRREGEWFVATDLVTQVVDQGKSRTEAVRRLQKGLRERYEALRALARKRANARIVEIEV